jgi:hypothetical protein
VFVWLRPLWRSWRQELDNQLLEPTPGALFCYMCVIVFGVTYAADMEINDLEAELAELEAEELDNQLLEPTPGALRCS